jgi:exopolysaccharide biosynthesis polyprenyl glycosylphosphotransferase
LQIPTLKEKLGFRARTKDPFQFEGYSIAQPFGLLAEDSFIRMLCLERKRTERSRKLLLLMLLDVEKLCHTHKKEPFLAKILSVLSSSTRDTDISGWYKNNSIVGVIFTEIGVVDKSSIRNAILTRVNTALNINLDREQIKKIHISLHFFPEDRDKENPGHPPDARLYPDRTRQEDAEKLPLVVKRMMDIAGSGVALIILSPLFIVIPLVIRLSSKGPIIFRQARVGRHGKIFTFLKFRSMHINNDPHIHKDYVNRFIAGKSDLKQTEAGRQGIYKIKDDPRVTRVGRFLRKTSLDELPQFWNVLRGEMSLVGPRPPIPYEFESYDIWHKRRVLEAKPGITGLWQVKGRSKTTFDEMVRLDLRYAKAWSLRLDVKILLQTPRAVLSRDGAF